MAGAASMGVAVRTVLSIVASFNASVFIYGFAKDRYLSCIDPHARWVQVVQTNFYINQAIIGAWIFYKEKKSSWINKAVLPIFLVALGSNTASVCIALQFFKLSPEESFKDPFYFILVRRQEGDDVEHKRSCSLVTSRLIFATLGCLMLGYFVYTLIVGRRISIPSSSTHNVWIAYKESSWITAFMWMLVLACFGSIGTCIYLLWQMSYLSPHQYVSLVLFKNSNIDKQASDPLLEAQANV